MIKEVYQTSISVKYNNVVQESCQFIFPRLFPCNISVSSLICSDAMARGMDIENVHYVVSYDFPPFLKTYIHRIGRTARAGRAGTTVTLLEKKEVGFVIESTAYGPAGC